MNTYSCSDIGEGADNDGGDDDAGLADVIS